MVVGYNRWRCEPGVYSKVTCGKSCKFEQSASAFGGIGAFAPDMSFASETGCSKPSSSGEPFAKLEQKPTT